MFKINILIYLTLFLINYGTNALNPFFEEWQPMDENSTSIRIKETISLYTLTMLTCPPLKTIDRKCETCQCDAEGRNFVCLTKLNQPCKQWHWYKNNDQPDPGSPSFQCNRRELLHNRYESCSMCACADNGKQIKCIYGQSTVCIYPNLRDEDNWVDPADARPW